MCRWAAWIGEPIYLEDIISRPDHSLVAQSRHAEECKVSTNADGFGVAWYDQRSAPGLYRNTRPAWSNQNLAALAHQIKSRLFLAHVRASTGTAISQNNCHPFAHKSWTFMHNGQVGGYDGFRKKVDMAIPESLYDMRKGATDSEALFLIALGHGLERNPKQAIETAILEMQDLSRQHGQAPHMRLSACLGDGQYLYAVRYASDQKAPTLYYRRDPAGAGWAVVSEPLDQNGAEWILLPAGNIARFSATDVTVAPLFDEKDGRRQAKSGPAVEAA